MRNRIVAARRPPWTETGPEWRAVTCGTSTERRMLRAYLALFRIPAAADGTRSVALVRFGNYEVRLTEWLAEVSDAVPPLWIELYSHHQAVSLDSCGLHELEEAVSAADELVARAAELHARSLRPWAGDDGGPLIG